MRPSCGRLAGSGPDEAEDSGEHVEKDHWREVERPSRGYQPPDGGRHRLFRPNALCVARKPAKLTDVAPVPGRRIDADRPGAQTLRFPP